MWLKSTGLEFQFVQKFLLRHPISVRSPVQHSN
jgi:hypothetical protein